MIKVLIVEDDPMLAEIHKSFIEKVEGYTIEGIAYDGKTALEILRDKEIDLVVLDVFIPKIDGMKVLENMRKENIVADVILVTAAKDIEKVKLALKLGAFDYLVKPFEYDRMKKSLDTYKERKTILDNNGEIQQNEIDFLLKRKGKISQELPKGVHVNTLSLILEELEQRKGIVFDAKDLADKLKISKVSVRKYLDYLEKEGSVKVTVDYGTRGRPSYKYMYI